MQTQEVAIKSHVKVTMKSDSEILEEVMVVAYGTAKKSALQVRQVLSHLIRLVRFRLPMWLMH